MITSAQLSHIPPAARIAAFPLTSAIRKKAEVTLHLTMEEARQLPGLGGQMVAAAFSYYGWRATTVNGVRTLYIMVTK